MEMSLPTTAMLRTRETIRGRTRRTKRLTAIAKAARTRKTITEVGRGDNDEGSEAAKP